MFALRERCTMHPGLCHSDRRVQSALRQARGAMLQSQPITSVRSFETLASRLLPMLDYPGELGTPRDRLDVLTEALRQLRTYKLISIHAKSAVARVTTKGYHAAGETQPSKSSSPRRHTRQNRRPGRRRAHQFARAMS